MKLIQEVNYKFNLYKPLNSFYMRAIARLLWPAILPGKRRGAMRPFADKEEMERLRNERDELIEHLNNFSIPEDEKRFIIRRISNITDKLLEKAAYAKDLE